MSVILWFFSLLIGIIDLDIHMKKEAKIELNLKNISSVTM